MYPDFTFKPQDIKVLIETPDQVFAEYTAHTKAAGTGRLIHHLFAGRLVAENGQIKLLRESLNVIAAAQALYPNGVAELPRPEPEIFSAPPGYHSYRASPPFPDVAEGANAQHGDPHKMGDPQNCLNEQY